MNLCLLCVYRLWRPMRPRESTTADAHLTPRTVWDVSHVVHSDLFSSGLSMKHLRVDCRMILIWDLVLRNCIFFMFDSGFWSKNIPVLNQRLLLLLQSPLTPGCRCPRTHRSSSGLCVSVTRKFTPVFVSREPTACRAALRGGKERSYEVGCLGRVKPGCSFSALQFLTHVLRRYVFLSRVNGI